MRIAYICADPGIPIFGQKGCSIHVQEVIRALLHQGVEVELFATRQGGTPPSDLENVPLHSLPPIPKEDLASREEAALRANSDLRLALEANAPFDLIYERYSLWSFAGMEYAQAVGVPGLLEVNAPLIEEQAKYRGLIHRGKAENVAKRVFNAANYLITVSDPIKTYVAGYIGDTQRVIVIPNGVNPNRFQPNLTPALPDNRFTVGFVGTLKPWHGLANLVEAFGRLYQRNSEIRLLIVGDGPERDNLVAQLSAKGLVNAAHFTGMVAPDEIPGLLASMSVAVAPYSAQGDFYFSPLKVYEYMAAGLPVIASNIGQLSNLIDHEVNGLLCPPGDSLALATALEGLLKEPELAKGLGAVARKTVLDHHTWDGVAKQILSLAGCVVGGKA